jgi:uncharacterized protein YdeI (YjbR/CyaY-like superfamily)
MQDLPTFHAPTRQAWRAWLLENYQKADNIWLIIYKKDSPTASVYYDEAVDEALCFGWIDSSVKKRDAESYVQFFSKRKPKSNWSKVNKEKVGKLIEAGLMHESGQAMIDLAKKTGTWTALDEVENLTLPTDLQQALDANPTAKGYFEAFPRSVKRGILEWLFNAKQAQTRQKRIEEIVTLAERNERANQYKPKTS